MNRLLLMPRVTILVMIPMIVFLSFLGQPVSAFRMAQYHQSIRRIVRSPLLRPITVEPPLPYPITSSIPPFAAATAVTTRMSQQTSKSSSGGDDDQLSLVSSIADSVQVSTVDGETLSLGQVLRGGQDEDKSDDNKSSPSSPVVLSCLSHFGDFNAWELTQQYVAALKPGGKLAESSSSSSSPGTTPPPRVVLVGIGSVASANQFAKDLELQDLIDSNRLTLVADPNGAVTEALNCYKGWLTVDPVHRERYPQSDVSPYIKLLGMIFGFGSPGTIQNVLYGYVGDTSGRKGVDGRAWVVDSLLQGASKGRFPKLSSEAFKDTPITSCLRPFELATLRLQTGLHIVQNWGKLVPQEATSGMTRVGDLLTRMGGTFVLDSSDMNCQWSYFDQGILNYADVDEVCQVVQAVSSGQQYVPWTKQQREALNQEREAALARKVKESSNTSQTPPAKPAYFAAPIEEVVAADPSLEVTEEEFAMDDDLLDELEDAIIEELDEEEVEELEAAFAMDGVEEGALIEEALSSSPGEASEETARTKELFQRSLLKARLKYASTAIATKRVEPKNSMRLSPPLSKTISEENNVPATSVITDDKELFHRNLLQAQYRYSNWSVTATSKEESQATPDYHHVGVSAASKKKKEMFHRAMLKAQMQYNPS